VDRTERFYKYEQLIRERGVVPRQAFLDALEVSPATFKRDIEYMRSRHRAPIEWDRDAGGYVLRGGAKGAARSELPGLWFNASEAYALLTMEALLKGLEPGLLSRHVKPLLDRLHAMLGSEDASVEEIGRRIRVLQAGSRPSRPEFFEVAASAVLKRKRLHIRHWSRAKDEITERTVSPQRLVYYRGNWYLDAWCHLREDIRSFALDGLKAAQPLEERAKPVSDKDLDEALASGYGIFTGKGTQMAVLRFSPQAARWVAYEQWHPKQAGRTEPGGAYVLEFPYADDRELLMDILRHGANVEVLAPKALRDKVAAAHHNAAKRYGR
jgi:predicted DNA-binding transcriptional regulator YafY